MIKGLYIILGVMLLLFVSCGRQQQAKSVVKDFVSDQLHRTDVSYINFSDIDSTHAIQDSLIEVLRERGAKGIQYQNRGGRTLLHIRANYLQGQDTCSSTFYLDAEAAGVVAYKDNF